MMLLQGLHARDYFHLYQNYHEFPNNCFDSTPIVNDRLTKAGPAKSEGPSPSEGRRLEFKTLNKGTGHDGGHVLTIIIMYKKLYKLFGP